jgi:hypothetical protein
MTLLYFQCSCLLYIYSRIGQGTDPAAALDTIGVYEQVARHRAHTKANHGEATITIYGTALFEMHRIELNVLIYTDQQYVPQELISTPQPPHST